MGSYDTEHYLKDYSDIKAQIDQLQSEKEPETATLERLAQLMRDITMAWNQASQDQRNRLASCLFEAVWIKNKQVVAVSPRPEFKPFFDLRYEGQSKGVLHWRPRGDLNP